MARTNNLSDFLTDVSAAIKQKTGDNTPIPASEFDTEIASIQTGGTYQIKSLTINQNGNYTLNPDTGYDAMSSVSIKAIVPDEPMKEYSSETAMNNDISNIETGEVVKVVNSGTTTYYVKEGTTTYQPFDFSILSDGDTISLENMKINNSALCDVVISSGDYITITFSNNNVPVLEFSFRGGSTKISGSVTLNNTDMFNYSAVNMGEPLTLSDADVETINSDSIWSSSTLLTVSSDALEDTAYTKLTNALLEQVTEYSMVKLSEGTGSSVNIFAQTTEPTTKKGIWLQADRTIEHIYGDDEIFIAGEWEADGTYRNIPYNFYSGASAVVGTDVYLIGSSSYTSRMYKYDTLTNTYTAVGNGIPYQFGSGRAVAIGTDIFLFGDATYSYNTAYKFDTLTGTYTQLTNIPYSFDRGGLAVVGTDIYLFSSVSMYANRTSTYKYDTLTDTWTKLTDNVGFNGNIAGAVGTDIYIYNSSGTPYKYNTLTDTFTQLASIPFGFSSNGRITIVGNDIYLFIDTTAYKYDTLTGTYRQLNNIPFSFLNGEAVKVGEKVMLFGTSSAGNQTKVQAMSLASSTYQDNSVVIAQGKYYTVGYGVELYNDDKAVLPLYYAFADAWFYTTANGMETNIPTYYGNGTSWIKIKN